MKLPSLTVKRRPVKKGAFRTYFANIVRSKKHRASTAAVPTMPEVDGDVPNLGIARALVVILIIHVVAIAGIFAHSHWVETPNRDEAAKAAMAGLEPKKALRDAATPLPRVSEEAQTHLITAGDTWDGIAEKYGVSVEDLRHANANMDLSPQRRLTIPPQQLAENPGDEGALPGDSTPVTTTTTVAATPHPALNDIRNGEMVPTTAAGNEVVVRPALKRPTEAQRLAAATGGTAEARPPKGSTPAATTTVATEKAPAKTTEKAATTFSNNYTTKQGDTFWKIAQSHKTTPEAIMKANNIKDAKKLKPGMTLRVP